MKKTVVYSLLAVALLAGACKGNKSESSPGDSAQVHTGNEGMTDSAKIQTTPVENGGKDTSGNGAGTTNMPKDTLTTTPK